MSKDIQPAPEKPAAGSEAAGKTATGRFAIAAIAAAVLQILMIFGALALVKSWADGHAHGQEESWLLFVLIIVMLGFAVALVCWVRQKVKGIGEDKVLRRLAATLIWALPFVAVLSVALAVFDVTHAGSGKKTAAAKDKPLNSYQVTAPEGYNVPIGPSPPVINPHDPPAGGGDLIYRTFAGETTILPVRPYSAIAPFNGLPTYQECLKDTANQDSYGVNAGVGDAFCLYEYDKNLIVGGVIEANGSNAINPNSVILQITVWSNTS